MTVHAAQLDALNKMVSPNTTQPSSTVAFMNTLKTPLADARLKVDLPNEDGSVHSTRTSLGEYIAQFEDTLQTKSGQLQSLWREYDDVETRIQRLGEDLLRDNSQITHVDNEEEDEADDDDEDELYEKEAAKTVQQQIEDMKRMYEKEVGELMQECGREVDMLAVEEADRKAEQAEKWRQFLAAAA